MIEPSAVKTTVFSDGEPCRRGTVRRSLGRYEDAIADFQHGARAHPQHADWARQAIEKTKTLQSRQENEQDE